MRYSYQATVYALHCSEYDISDMFYDMLYEMAASKHGYDLWPVLSMACADDKDAGIFVSVADLLTQDYPIAMSDALRDKLEEIQLDGPGYFDFIRIIPE